jgi:enoyl-CoA hydratase/carnithine racemase
MELSRESFKEDVARFRANFKEEALSSAEKAVRLEKKGPVGVITFDAPNSKANTLGTPVMLRFFELLTEVEKDNQIGSLVILSAKPTIFIAGADIAEIQKLSESGDAKTL